MASPPMPVAPAPSSGWLIINDVQPQGAGAVSGQVYQDSGHTVLQACTSSSLAVRVFVRSASPLIKCGSVNATLTRDAGGGYYSGHIDVTLPGSGPISVVSIGPDGLSGAMDTVSISVDSPPSILTLDWTGGYPGSQTELKAGDAMQVHGTTDKPCVGLNVSDSGACGAQSVTFTSTTTFTATVTIADRGTTLQALRGRMAARNAAGAAGATADTATTVNLNNLRPTVTLGAKTYPSGQGALKDSEACDVAVTLANFDAVTFDSPTAELSIANPTSPTSPKTCTRIAGSYNDSTNNLRCTATRAANASQAGDQACVKIANIAPAVAVTLPAARLVSGGNDGTTVQVHAITLTSNQEIAVPSLASGAGGGTFLGVWIGGPKVWTRSLQVHDDDVPGSYDWSGLLATNLAGIPQTAVGTGASYTLGGFVKRQVTFAAYSQTATIHATVSTYAKLQAGRVNATNQPAQRNPTQGNHSDLPDNFTVESLGTNPTTVWWNDVTQATIANSTGTAYISDVEEVP